jgi:hypothetical protein
MRFFHRVQGGTDLLFGITFKLPLIFAWEL